MTTLCLSFHAFLYSVASCKHIQAGKSYMYTKSDTHELLLFNPESSSALVY